MSWIYGILDADAKAIKLGYSKDVAFRLKMLQTGNPRRLSVAFTLRGSQRMERRCHQVLTRQGLHIHGEWFRYSNDVCDAVAQITRDPDTLACHVKEAMKLPKSKLPPWTGPELNPKRLPDEEETFRLMACLTRKAVHAMGPGMKTACGTRLPGRKRMSEGLRDYRHITCEQCQVDVDDEATWDEDPLST